MWNFFDLAKRAGLNIQHNPADAPETPGYYMLFSILGNFIYVGKATNLRDRLQDHMSEQEPNYLLRLIGKYFIHFPTTNLDEAEMGEAQVFDRWVRASGEHPLCNEKRPPRSTITDDEMMRIKLRIAFGLS